MKTKFKAGEITLFVKEHPVPMIEIHKGKSILFGTSNPESLMNISKVIAELAKELNKEGIKQMTEHNKNLKKKGKEE